MQRLFGKWKLNNPATPQAGVIISELQGLILRKPAFKGYSCERSAR